MGAIISYLKDFFVEGRVDNVNKVIFLVAVVVLVIAFIMCVMISRKNRLYIKPHGKIKKHKKLRENEVVS